MDDSAPSMDVGFSYAPATFAGSDRRDSFVRQTSLQARQKARIRASSVIDEGFLHSAAKRGIDIVGAVVLALVFSPVLLFVIASLAREGGSILFGHTRIGKGGRAFRVYKFRTMVPNANELLRKLLASDPELQAEWRKDHKLRNDPRITAIGRFLRKTSLDELPQLINVLKGEMSLVGPRPIVRDEIRKYGRTIRHYLSAKPGLTGLWQVCGRNDIKYRRRVAMDRYYAANCSMRLDITVLLKTVGVVLFRRGAY